MLSGWLPPDTEEQYRLAEMSGFPIFQGHGTLDEVVHPLYARMTRDFLSAAGVDLTYREYPVGHAVPPEEVAELVGWFENLLEPDRGPGGFTT
jgi:phospholipase/carboxylesterase